MTALAVRVYVGIIFAVAVFERDDGNTGLRSGRLVEKTPRVAQLDLATGWATQNTRHFGQDRLERADYCPRKRRCGLLA